jgi:hypothetical protein
VSVMFKCVSCEALVVEVWRFVGDNSVLCVDCVNGGEVDVQ